MNVKQVTSLKVGKPYMIRNDGEVFELKDVHPYINYDVTDDYNYLLLEEGKYADWWIWFYENTQIEDVKELIERALRILYTRWHLGAKSLPKVYEKKIFPYFSIGEDDIIDGATYDDFINLADTASDIVNQEFLRCRVGGYYVNDGDANEIYFRVSSTDFNWFDIIWTLVNSVSKRGVKKITITKDNQALGVSDVIRCKGVAVVHLDVSTFLELPGNPVVEDLHKLVNKRVFVHSW